MWFVDKEKRPEKSVVHNVIQLIRKLLEGNSQFKNVLRNEGKFDLSWTVLISF